LPQKHRRAACGTFFLALEATRKRSAPLQPPREVANSPTFFARRAIDRTGRGALSGGAISRIPAMIIPRLAALFFAAMAVSVFAEKPEEKAAEKPVAKAEDEKLDFGDGSSSTLTTKAWQALEAKKFADALAFTAKCREKWEEKALEMQKSLTAAVPAEEQEKVRALYALNDVGTCYFIRGRALEALGKKKEAIEAYQFLVKKLAFAQCWNPEGFFWKPADAATERLEELAEKPAK
jgi:hypothetical protein